MKFRAVRFAPSKSPSALSLVVAGLLGSTLLAGCGGGGSGTSALGATNNASVVTSISNSKTSVTLAVGKSITVSGASVSSPSLMSSMGWSVSKMNPSSPDLAISNANCTVAIKSNQTLNNISQSKWGCDASVGISGDVLSDSSYRLTLSGVDSSGNSANDFIDISVPKTVTSGGDKTPVAPIILSVVGGSKTISVVPLGQSLLASAVAISNPNRLADIGWSVTKLTTGAPDLIISNSTCVVSQRSNVSGVDPTRISSSWSCDAVVLAAESVSKDSSYRISFISTDTLGNSSTDYRDITLQAVVENPITLAPLSAYVQPTLTAYAGQDVTLNCNASGGKLNPGSNYRFNWSTISNPIGLTLSTNSSTPSSLTFRAPSVNSSTTIVYLCEVTDDARTTASAASRITFIPTVNFFTAIANAGSSQTVSKGTTVTLNGTQSSGPNGLGLYYTWSQLSGPTVSLNSPSLASPTFKAPDVMVPTTLIFKLIVQTSPGNQANAFPSEISTTAVYVNPDPDLVLTVTPASVTGVSKATSINVAVSPSVATLYYEWTQTVGASVTISGGNTSTASFITPATTGQLLFRVRVSRKPISTAPASEIFTSTVVVDVQ